MLAAITLKACPFCGSRSVALRQLHIAMVKCPDCHAIVSFGGRESALQTQAAWNERKNECTTKS